MTEILLTEQRYRRSVVSAGDRGRLKALFHSRQRPLIYGAIGGSITQGAASSSREKCYAGLFAQWLDSVSTGGCEFINAGIGASDSHFGAFRVGRDLLSAQPDIVTIEYAVNDIENRERELSYESLIRQCLTCPSQPAVILLFTMRKDGTNCQEVQSRIGTYFNLPMLSYRDSLYPDVEAGVLKWEDLSPDEVHPNDRGHQVIADMLSRFVLECQENSSPDPVRDYSEPRNQASTKFDTGAVLDATAMQVLHNQGWQTGPHKGGYTGYQADQPGSEITIRFTARYAALGYKKFAGDFGRAEVMVDAGGPVVLEGYYERPLIQAWAGGHTVLETLLDESIVKEHTLTIRLREDRHVNSGGHNFDVGYLLLSS